jgi:carboxymethylenebutenolidase
MTSNSTGLIMSTTQLTATDGHTLDAYCAHPAVAPQGAIVVLQEIFGVNPHIRSLCDRYAALGYLAIAPHLFDRVARSQEMGYDAEGVARGREVKGKLTDEQALLDVQAAVDWAAARLGPQPKVAVIGFCWGGTLAWLAAARLSGVACAVAYYGTNIAGYLGDAPKVPVLLHFGEQDTHIPPEHVARIAQAWPQLEIHRYEAGHGFNCDDRPAFHQPSAQAAALRTHAFLESQFKC